MHPLKLKTMTYATATNLLTRFDAAEIAQRLDRGIPRLVDAELLTAAAAGGDLSGFPAEAVTRVQVGMGKVQRALQDADDTINSYINARYTLPLSAVPAVLQRVAAELARFYLYDDQVTDLIKDRHAANIKWLEGVSKGTNSLGAEVETGVQPVSSAGAELISGDSVWKRDRSQGFL